MKPRGRTGSATHSGLLLFNFIGFVFVYLLQRLQGVLPLNPQNLAAMSPDSSFNTAVSFASNTNWQGYGGEATMSYLTQMLGLGVQNFVSAASGMAVLVAVIRGFVRRQASEIGNFWVDLTRSTLYILLPLSLVLAIILMSQGVVQTFAPYRTASLVEQGARATDQPTRHRADDSPGAGSKPDRHQAARHQRRRLLQHQFGASLREPHAAVEFPRAAVDQPDRCRALLHVRLMVGDRRQGWAILAAMMIIFVPLTIGTIAAEQAGNPRLTALGVDQVASDSQSGGNMEGKETRFGIASSAIWATATTAASNGSVNAMHDSFTPLGGLVPTWLMELGEVVFGGVGSGLYGMLMFVIVAVFIAGLMVGRTPEYLGKKLESYEIKMASLVLLIPPAIVLIGTAIASVVARGDEQRRESRRTRILGDPLRLLLGRK